MQKYHKAWLERHPERTEQWLRDRLADGFDIHHMDGDHSNDDPENLVLIEGLDHALVHGGALKTLLESRSKRQADREQYRACYEMKERGMDWPTVSAYVLGTRERHGTAAVMARTYARENDLAWPVQALLQCAQTHAIAYLYCKAYVPGTP